jgi:hypothetical protein
MTEGRKEFCVFAAAMALAGEIRIDIVAAGNAPRRPRWRQHPKFASQEQLATELVA